MRFIASLALIAALLHSFSSQEAGIVSTPVSATAQSVLPRPSVLTQREDTHTPERSERLNLVRAELAEELRNHPSAGGRWEGLERDEYIAEVDEWASNLLVIMEELNDKEKVALAKELAAKDRVDYSTYFAYQVAAKYADGPVELPALTPHDPQGAMLAYGIVDRYGLELYRRSGVKTQEEVLRLKVEALKATF